MGRSRRHADQGQDDHRPTLGNAGVALAMIGAIKGYDVENVMSDTAAERGG
ncbi:MAG: hypothetical protein GX307_05995 [Euryarchaeota archaeon]|nr:hypothetical protein [Euryarchaeota archaeon]